MGRAVCACECTKRAAIGIAGASSGSPKAKLPKEAGQFGSKLEARVESSRLVRHKHPSKRNSPIDRQIKKVGKKMN